MSDQQQEMTVEDVWVNRLAQRIGILTAQNERLMIENEALQQQVAAMQEPHEPEPPNGEYAYNGGALHGEVVTP
jgi:regulator of replication initiation timing